MASIAYVNGRYLPHVEASVHIEDRGFQFADGVYEYFAFYNRTLLDSDLHWRRLERSLDALQIEAPVKTAALSIIARELIERNGRDDGGLYIQITRGVAKRDHPFPKQAKPSLVMTVCTAKLSKPHEVEKGVAVITQADIRWKRRDIKSVSLLANILAKQEATRKSVREAWLMENGVVSEGSVSNAYIVTKAGEVMTHPADEHILGGVVRDVVLKLARKAGISVAERPFTLAEAKQAAEAFITSTSANILAVVKIDDAAVGTGKPGPVVRRLQELYDAHVLRQTGKRL